MSVCVCVCVCVFRRTHTITGGILLYVYSCRRNQRFPYIFFIVVKSLVLMVPLESSVRACVSVKMELHVITRTDHVLVLQVGRSVVN